MLPLLVPVSTSMVPLSTPLWLAAVVFLAFGIEAALGFGCNVLAVTMAVHLLPLDVLLPVLVALNLVVSSWIALRHRDGIDHALLFRRILPLMLLGMPFGMLLFNVASGPWLKGGFGVFVTLLAAVELWRSLRQPAAPAPLSTPASVVALAGAGLMHGLYASGGPLAVYYASRSIGDKRRFRSTLSLLWLLLNLVLYAGYLWRGAVTLTTLRLAAPQLLPLVAGIFAGERLHTHIDERTFRRLVFALLLAGGVVLVVSVLG